MKQPFPTPSLASSRPAMIWFEPAVTKVMSQTMVARPIVRATRTHQQRMANLDDVTIHVTDNTIYDRHPLRRIYSRADVTPRKARLDRERREVENSIRSVASAVIGAIILGAGIIAGFALSSFQ